MKNKTGIVKIGLLTVTLLAAACTICGCNSAEHEHKVVVDEAVPATCITSGLTAGAHCADCGEIFTEQQVIEAVGHKIITLSAVEPSCTTSGLSAGAYCAVCGEVFKEQSKVEPLGHDPIVDAAVAPTAYASGLTQGSHCADCGAVIQKQTIVPATGDASIGSSDAGTQDAAQAEEKAAMLLEALSQLLTCEKNTREIGALKALSIDEVRPQINTMGDAIQFMDLFGAVFWSGGDPTYSPQTKYDDLRSGRTNSVDFTYLVGYLLSDNVPNLQVVTSVCYENGTGWVYTGLLVPYGSSWLIVSPGAYSESYRNCNNYPGFFKPALISSWNNNNDVISALRTTGVTEDGTLGNVFLFSPGEKEYSFAYENNNLTCNVLEPIGAGAKEKDYDTMISRLLATELSSDKIEKSVMAADTMRKLFSLTDADIETAADNIHTLSEAIAFLIMREYKADGYDWQIEDGDLIWHFHSYVENIYVRNWGDCGSTSTLMGYLLRDDYDEAGLISITYAKGQGGGHVINYVKSDATYYVFDVVSLVANGYTGAGYNFSFGNTLEDAFAEYCSKTGSNEIFAFYWEAFGMDIPVGWYTYDYKWGTVVLPEQYRRQISVLYQASNAKYEYKEITYGINLQIESGR